MVNIPYFIEILFAISTSFFLFSIYIILPSLTQIVRVIFGLKITSKEKGIIQFDTVNKEMNDDYNTHSKLHHSFSFVEKRKANFSKVLHRLQVK
jgi:hypothetical protein